MGSATLTGKLLQSHILLDPCTIFVLLLLLLLLLSSSQMNYCVIFARTFSLDDYLSD